MLPEFDHKLRAFAAVIVRIGLNLQRGQHLLIAEPYELQGVARSAEVIVEAVRAAALAAGCPHPGAIDVIWGDGPRLREFAAKGDWRGFTKIVTENARQMDQAVRGGAALLFLQGSQPGLMDGIPAERVAELRRIGWEHFGPISQQLIAGATNWTVAPAPSPVWAHAVYADLPSEQRLAALWDAVFEACRVGPALDAGPGLPANGSLPEKALAAWQSHLLTLRNFRAGLNAQRTKVLRYMGAGTDLAVSLPAEHLWCTAQLSTKSGLPFVANLPTEEVFTLPHRDSATGTVRVSRPVSYGGTLIDGIELEFQRGCVLNAKARLGENLLKQLLETDDGAGRLGEVALVGLPLVGKPSSSTAASAGPTWQSSGRSFQHPLLDENACNHIALGEAYAFCLRAPDAPAFNRSLIHVDLPLDATSNLASPELS